MPHSEGLQVSAAINEDNLLKHKTVNRHYSLKRNPISEQLQHIHRTTTNVDNISML